MPLRPIELNRHFETSLVEQIANGLRRQILARTLAPGEKLPPVVELAVELKAGVVTVRQALEKLAQEGAVIKRPRIGTLVQAPEVWNQAPLAEASTWARGLHIAIVGSEAMLPDYPGGKRSYRVAEAFEAAVSAEGGQCAYLIMDSPAAVATLPGRLRDFSAVFCISQPDEVMRSLVETKLPVVACDYAGLYKVNNVAVDWEFATQEALRQLIGLGHRRIAMASYHILGVPEKAMNWARERERVFVQVARLEGLPVGEADIYYESHPVEELCDPSLILAGRRLGTRILPEPYTAVLAVNDYISVGLAQAAAAAGRRIPEDLSLIGFDNYEGAARLGLDTIVPASAADGRTAARLLGEIVRHPQATTLVNAVNRPVLLQRQSTGPAPEAAAVGGASSEKRKVEMEGNR